MPRARETSHGATSSRSPALSRPPQIVAPQSCAGGRGLVFRLGVPTPARFDGEFRNGLHDKARVHRRAFRGEGNEPAA